MLEDYLDVPHVRCVSSCTAALMLAIKVLGIEPGDEVLVPAMTFIASANAIEHAGATPVLVDSEPGHRPDRSRRRRGGGHAAYEGDHACALRGAARRHRPRDEAFAIGTASLVIEDAAHAIGAEWQRNEDRRTREPHRLLLLRDEKHHDGRGRRARDDDGDRLPRSNGWLFTG